MALKIVLAGIVGGVLHMIWGLVYWFAVPIDDFVKRVPAEHEVLEILSDALPGPGVYFLPIRST